MQRRIFYFFYYAYIVEYLRNIGDDSQPWNR
jgi:hypothetical protein